MQRPWRRPLTLTTIVMACVVLCPLIAFRVVAGPPDYRACVSALENVTAGMPWVEAEAHLAEALAVGGERKDGRSYIWAGPEPGTVWVTCWRNGDGVTEPPRGIAGSVWVWLVRIAPDLYDAVPLAPADFTWLEAVERDDTVAVKRLQDCLTIPFDNFGEPEPLDACRPRAAADR